MRMGSSARSPAKKKAPLRRRHIWRQPAIPPLMPSTIYSQLQQGKGVSPPSEPTPEPTLDQTTTNKPEPDTPTPEINNDQEPEPEPLTLDNDYDQELDHDTDNDGTGSYDDSDDGPQQPRLMRNHCQVMMLMTSDSKQDAVSYLNYCGFVHFNDFGYS